MGELDNLIKNLNVPTNVLKYTLLQTVLLKIQKTQSPSEEVVKEWDEVADILWKHLQQGLIIYDDQLLCATCFYTVITVSAKKNFYVKEILTLLQNRLDRNDNSLLISLLYGLFQSTFLQKEGHGVLIVPILNCMFKILTTLAYDYAWYTFLVFKVVSSFKRVIGTKLQNIIFSEANQNTLLYLVNQNWENPITGVRDLNRIIFQTLFSVMDESLKSTIKGDINSFYWNKAKYLMLSEIIACEYHPIIAVVQYTDWVEGLFNSLRKPGLVSAGADMYFAMLKNIGTAEEWCSIFLKRISALLTGKSVKAIQNFTNYWCLTTLKTFPSLMSIILKEIVNTKNHERRLLSTLCMMKQGNKLGLLKSDMELVIGLNAFIHQGLEHSNVNIRMCAFDIVCVSQGNALPCGEDYNLIYQYLLKNCNSDSTILRIHLLGSFKSFLVRLHTSFLNNIQSKNKDVSLDEDLTLFCQQIQDLVIDFLDLGGNYQRKVTSIKLCDLIFTYFNEVPRKNQAQTRAHTSTLLDILKEKRQWKLSNQFFLLKLVSLLHDPADDVREHVAQILLTHNFHDLRQPHLIGIIKENVLKCMSSKFFYEISCGHSMVKLLANILLKEKQENFTFKSIEDIFMFGCKELDSEVKLKRDMMESIQAGKQLHSYLGVVIASLTVCLQNSYKLEGISIVTIQELLNSLEGISNQFAWEEETSISLNFSEMSDMVQNIISRSGYDPNNEKDRTKISGMHQLVLNCLWMNVKTCCELSSLLIKYNTEDSFGDICKRCLNIITHVLETSRHKGAIEAAGAALGNAVHHLTSLPEGSELSKLPEVLLKAKLNELLCEAGKMSSVTRKGAGLSIMLHRIVASDMKKGKPYFHYFMKTLLDICEKTEDVPAQLNCDIDNEKDLPKAIYMHFISKIVTESSLASELMHYSARLGQLAFYNLTSKFWQIRNAALQLYGALVPKLIGQKKCGEDKETISTVASDEFRMHLPELWKYMLIQLECKNPSNLLDHSDLVPILNILANTARRYNFLYDSMEQESSYTEMFHNLMSLLGSPIYTVRRLTAKCIYNNFPFESVFSAIRDMKEKSENLLHGCLMLTGICHCEYFSMEEYKDMFSDLEDHFSNIMKANTHSYVTKTVFEEIFAVTDETSVTEKVQSTFAELTKNKHAPGVHLWGKRRIEKCIRESSWHEFYDIIKTILDESDIEQFGEVIQERILRKDVLPSQLNPVCEVLLRYNFENDYKSTIIWKILYEISLTIRMAEFDIANIVNYFENRNDTVPYRSRFMIPVIATFIAYEKDNERIKKFVNYVFSLLCEDFELRYIAAMANNNLSLYFSKLKDSVKVLAIKTAVILLQDEDEDIRSLGVEFYENLAGVKCAPHPYICLEKLLKFDFLASVLQEPYTGIPSLCCEITDALRMYSKNELTKDQYNPFANDSKNIYIEIEMIKMQIKTLQNVLQ